MYSYPNTGTSSRTQESAGPSEDTVRRLFVYFVTSIKNRITEYEDNLRANEAQLQALEKTVAIFYDKVMVLERLRDHFNGIEEHLSTNTKGVKEKE